ncbi:hypothetical protein ABBQ38_008180 [Trebouxia sp. C0009 RCD-2024]
MFVQKRRYFKCGHCHVSQDEHGQDTFGMDAVLHWVYGTYVSPPDYARDLAQRSLDQKHRIEDAHDLLLEALKSKNTCMHSVKLCKDLCTGLVNMRAFLESLKAAKLRGPPATPSGAAGTPEQGEMPSAEGQSGGDPPQNTGTGGESSGSQPQLPDRVIVRLLQREYLLMLGGLHLLHLRMFHGAEDLKLLTKHESTIRPELNRNAQLREGVDPKLVRQVATLLKEAEQSQVPEAAVSGFVATGVDAMNPELSERPCIKPLLLWHHYTKHMQAVEKGLSTTRETMACNKRLLTQKTAWASHTLKLLQVMLAAQDPTTSASTTHAGSQACTTAAPSPTDSAVADCTSQSSQPGPAEPNTALPLSSSTTQGGLAASPVESEAASSPQEDEDSNPQNNADLDRILSRILSMAKLQRLAEKVKLLGAEYFRVAGADCTPRSDADRWSGGTSTEGEDDFNWVPQCASLHLTLQMPDPRVVAAAGSLLRGPELTAERVGQFFLQEVWQELQSEVWEYDVMTALADTAKEDEEEQADIRAALVHLEGQVIDLACDDIGGAVNSNVLLPMLCHQLEAKYEMDISQKRAAVQQAVTEKQAAAASKAAEELLAMEEPAQQAVKKASHSTAKPKAAAVTLSSEEVDSAKAEAKKAKKQRQKAKKQAASVEQQQPTQASAAQLQPLPQAVALQQQQQSSDGAKPNQQQQQQSSDGAKPNQQQHQQSSHGAKPEQQPSQQLHVGDEPGADAAAEPSPGLLSSLSSCTDAQAGRLNAGAAMSNQTNGPEDVALHADAHTDPVSNGITAKVAAAAPAWEPHDVDVHGADEAQTGVPADVKAHGAQTAESAGGASPSAGEPPPGVSQPKHTHTKQQGQQAALPLKSAMPGPVPHSGKLLPAGGLGSSKASGARSARLGQIQSDWGAAHPSKAAPHPEAAHVGGHSQTELSQDSDNPHAAETLAMDLQHEHIRAVFQLPGSSSPAARAGLDAAGRAMDDRAVAEAAPVLTPYRAPTEHCAILFQCPLTKALMQKPVIAADGYTYEKQAIVSWLRSHDTSPVTGSPLAHMHLMDNAVISSLIQQQRM